MDEARVKEWIRQCLPWTPHNEQSLLVWDSFQAHLTDEVKANLNRRKIDVAVQCFRQSAPLQESRITIRDGPQKNEKRANLALSFYKAAGLTQA